MKSDSDTSSCSQDHENTKPDKEETMAALKQKFNSMATLKENNKKPDCFKCQGLKHVAKQCHNRTMISRAEYYGYLLHTLDSDEQVQQHI